MTRLILCFQQWNKKADEHNEAKQWNVNKTAEKQHSPEEALGQKALQELSEAQQCGEVPMEFKIEMIDDSIENNVLVSNNVSVSSNVSVGKGDCRAYNATNELSGPSRMVNVGNVEMASWQNRDRSLNSDLTGICAIEPGRTTLNQTYDEFCLPSSEIKTEPMDEGNSYPKVCDNANSITLHDKQGPCENLEEHNFEAGKNNGAQEFENDWLRQNNIVIKKEPEDECTEQDSRISSAVSESPMELCGGQGVSDDKTSPEKVIDDNLRENSDSVQISNDLKGDSLSDPAEIKSEPVDGDYGGT